VPITEIEKWHRGYRPSLNKLDDSNLSGNIRIYIYTYIYIYVVLFRIRLRTGQPLMRIPAVKAFHPPTFCSLVESLKRICPKFVQVIMFPFLSVYVPVFVILQNAEKFRVSLLAAFQWRSSGNCMGRRNLQRIANRHSER
jgi:hypothetical protein